jgi:hypothetical protein
MPMRTHLEFRSSAFPAQPGEEGQINPGRWGKLLAEYLRGELTKRELPGGAPFTEDWGWCIPLDNKDFGLWVGCGNYEEYPDGFLCFIEPRKPYVRKLFSKISTVERVGQVAVALEAALKEHRGVHDMRWWSESEGI